MRKWWLSFEVETWKFTENKLLKLFNSMKANFLFAGFNRNRKIQKNKCYKKAHFMDNALKTRGIIYLNVETSVLVCPPIKLSGYAPAQTLLLKCRSYFSKW